MPIRMWKLLAGAGAVICVALIGAPQIATAADGQNPPLPEQMADTGGGTQLITVTAQSLASRTADLQWWHRTDDGWHLDGATEARLGADGLADGATRVQGTLTTPTGLNSLPFAFGIDPAPHGTTMEYRAVTGDSWWCEDNQSTSLNRWVSPLPQDCRATESEHLIDYRVQYAHSVVIGYNYTHPVQNRGAGIFLHVNGEGFTAGCVSVPAQQMSQILAWLNPQARPHIAIGTVDGPTSILRY